MDASQVADELRRDTRKVEGLHNVTLDLIPVTHKLLAEDGDSFQAVLGKLEVAIREVCEPLAQAHPGDAHFHRGRSKAAQALLRHWFPQPGSPEKVQGVRKELADGKTRGSVRDVEDKLIKVIAERLVMQHGRGQTKAALSQGTASGGRLLARNPLERVCELLDALVLALSMYPTNWAWSVEGRASLSNPIRMVYRPLALSAALRAMVYRLSEANMEVQLSPHAAQRAASPVIVDLTRSIRDCVVFESSTTLATAYLASPREARLSTPGPFDTARHRRLCLQFRNRLLEQDGGPRLVLRYAGAVLWCMRYCDPLPCEGCLIHTIQRNAEVLTRIAWLAGLGMMTPEGLAEACNRLPKVMKPIKTGEFLTGEELHVDSMAGRGYRLGWRKMVRDRDLVGWFTVGED